MESIFTQALTDWELIVCDSYSDDGTWEYLQQFKDDPRVRLYQVPREGLYAGWNECLKRCRGTYVHIAPADDTCLPTFLSRTVGLLEKQKTCDLAVTQFHFIDADDRIVSPPPARRLDAVYGKSIAFDVCRPREAEILIHYCIGGIPWVTASALVFRRTLLDSVGLFPADIGPNADVIWSLKCSLFSDTLSVPEFLATWRQLEGQASSSSPFADRASLYARLLADMLDEYAYRIPPSWKRDPNWKEQLLFNIKNGLLRMYCLDRRTCKQQPLRFLRGAIKALQENPHYLWKRMRSGFSWNSPEYLPEEKWFWELVQRWNVDWAPRQL